MAIDAILLEFEGIVADTAAIHRETLAHVLGVAGITPSDEEYWEHCAGTALDEGIRAMVAVRGLALDATDIDLLAHRAEQRFSTHIGKGVVLADGVRSTLERLAARARLAVVSRLKRADVEAIISMGRLDELFSFVIGSGDVARPKPHPEGYELALRRLGRFRGDAAPTVVALESGRHGIRAARAAGLRCLAVGTQPAHIVLEAEAYIEAVADLTVPTIATLLALRSRHD